MRKTDGWYELAAGEMPKILADKLEPFGFRRDGDVYFYAEELLAGSFILHVKISKNGVVSTLLMDTESEEPYVLHRHWRQPAYPYHESAWYGRAGGRLSRWRAVFPGLAYESEILVYHMSGWQYTDDGASAKN